ncbi:hypothetical protein FRC17_009165 [Serendipita sp. 399]|nr:hypothetical protein FRC17_009165 [Serendipita sp. 399]
MRATKPLDEQDAVLEALMEDYIRATELQKSLKKRIEAAMKEKEEKAKQEEEVARLLLIQAEEKTARVRKLNQQLQDKMGRAEGHEEEGDEFPAEMAIDSLKLPPTINRRSMVGFDNPIISPRAMSPAMTVHSVMSPRTPSPSVQTLDYYNRYQTPSRPTSWVGLPHSRPLTPVEVRPEIANEASIPKRTVAKKKKKNASIMPRSFD